MGLLDIFKKRSGSETSPIEEWETRSKIKRCCDNRYTVSVEIDEHAVEFMSIFLECNPDKGWIMIDRLVPEKGNEYIGKSKSLRVTFRDNGVIHSFDSRYLGSVSGGKGGIKIAFPVRIEAAHRREFFRVEPSLKNPVTIHVIVDDDPPLEFETAMRDISEGGLSFRVGEETFLSLKPGRHLKEIRFSLPVRGTIRTKGIIRAAYTEENEKIYTCGVEFLELTDSQMNKIYQYVVDRQREELKKER